MINTKERVYSSNSIYEEPIRNAIEAINNACETSSEDNRPAYEHVRAGVIRIDTLLKKNTKFYYGSAIEAINELDSYASDEGITLPKEISEISSYSLGKMKDIEHGEINSELERSSYSEKLKKPVGASMHDVVDMMFEDPENADFYIAQRKHLETINLELDTIGESDSNEPYNLVMTSLDQMKQESNQSGISLPIRFEEIRSAVEKKINK